MAEIGRLKNSFTKGYFSQFTSGFSPDQILLFDIDLKLDTVKWLAEDVLSPDKGQILYPKLLSQLLKELNRSIDGF